MNDNIVKIKRCNLCFKSQFKVKCLIILEENFNICNECIDLCNEIIKEKEEKK